MSNHLHLHNGQPYDDEHAALVSAFALGQLAGDEKLAIEAQVARDPALQREVSETRRLAGLLAETLRDEAAPAPSAQLREVLEARAEVNDALRVSPPARHGVQWSRWLGAVAASAAIGGSVIAYQVYSTHRNAKEVAGLTAYYDKDDVQYAQTGRNSQWSSSKDRLARSKVTLHNGQQAVVSDDSESMSAAGHSSGFRGNNVGGVEIDVEATVSPLHSKSGTESEFPIEAFSAVIDQSGGGRKGSGQSSLQNRLAGDPTMEYRSTVWPEATQRHKEKGGKTISGPFGNATVATSPSKDLSTADSYKTKGGHPGIPPQGTPPQDPQGRVSKTVTKSEVDSRGFRVALPSGGNGNGKPAAAEVQYSVDGLAIVDGESRVRQYAERDASAKNVEELSKLSGEERAEYFRQHRDLRSSAEQYDEIIENAFLPAKMAPLSTFSIDVDTASYANTRRFLAGGQLPPRDAVRVEELINYFRYDDPQPQGNAPFSANMELAECPWTPGHHLLRVGLQGKAMHNQERPASNLVFLLDVSGSMSDQNKLPLVKQAMNLLIRELNEKDRVTIVTYAGSEGVALESTSGDQKDKIINAVNTLQSNGSTHASAGITLAYQLAQQQFIKEGANRVILCTDGDFNVGVTSDEALVDLITSKAKGGVFLSVLGFGMGNLKDAKMEKLADKGNGNYAYIDTLREARKVLVEQMSGSLVTIAKDVKIQIEFNPAVVAAYRQIGYENRVLAARDFNDDTKDAGEIGAGHCVTALYEVVLVGHEKHAAQPASEEIPLKYQKSETKVDAPAAEPAQELALTDAAKSGELLTLKLRFKQPDGEKSELLEFPLKQDAKKFGAASENLRFASAVAAFGMILRESQYRGGATMSAVEEIAAASLGKDPSGYRTEFLELVRKAEGLGK